MNVYKILEGEVTELTPGQALVLQDDEKFWEEHAHDCVIAVCSTPEQALKLATLSDENKIQAGNIDFYGQTLVTLCEAQLFHFKD